MNEAAINTAKEGRKFLTQTDIEKAFIKVGIGAEKRSKVISEKDKKITAYHEAGHAILFHVLPDVGPVHTVSIIPTGVGAAGYTMPLPEQDELHMTKGRMLQNIMVSLGGRIAEEIIFDDITTGASQDIKQATSMSRAMVTEYGMSEKLGTNIVLFRFLFCANQHSLPKCPAKSARNLHKRRLISRPVSCFELFMLLSPEFQLPLTAFLHPGTALQTQPDRSSLSPSAGHSRNEGHPRDRE